MKWGLITLFLIAVASVSAVQGPITYQGTDYYVVTSTDPTEDTGDEVCAKLGMTCIGYTEPGDGVCKLAHPSAASTSSASGDQSGVYCNGAPQGGVCATSANMCHTCPACSNGVDCSQAIGGLYREMYVECQANIQCPITMTSRTTQDLLSEVPILNTKLQACPVTLPGSVSKIINNGAIQVDISMNSGSTESLMLNIANKQVTRISRGSGQCKQKVTVSESDLDSILSNNNRATAISWMYGNKRIKVSGCTFIRKIITTVANPFTRFFVRRGLPANSQPQPVTFQRGPVTPTLQPSTPPPPAQPPRNPNCGLLGEQCNNRACATGICAAPYEYVNGQWRPVNYRCLDQNSWNSFCRAHGNTRPAWDCVISMSCTP